MQRDLKRYGISGMKRKSAVLQYLKFFAIWFAVVAVLVVIAIITAKNNKERSMDFFYDSPNTERVYGDRRVFDFGEQLTDEEEASLESYIRAAEKQICNDIVIVTLNQTLADYEPEYMSRYSMRITPDKYVMVFADKFWEDNKFGYDMPQILDGTASSGDGVILVDNVFREPETGKIYTWMGTTGAAEIMYSSENIDYALDAFYETIDYDYYRACVKWVDHVVSDLTPYGVNEIKYDPTRLFPWIVAIISAAIFIAVSGKSKAGENTVTPTQYVIANTINFSVVKDQYIRKTVSKTYVGSSSSSSGGGGGHHTSGGGGSHGGGGHSR